MRPRSGLLASHIYSGSVWHPRRWPIPASRGPLGPRSEEPWRCAPWHRSPSHDLRRAPYDHPDFTSNALSEDLCSASQGDVSGWQKPHPQSSRRFFLYYSPPRGTAEVLELSPPQPAITTRIYGGKRPQVHVHIESE